MKISAEAHRRKNLRAARDTQQSLTCMLDTAHWQVQLGRRMVGRRMVGIVDEWFDCGRAACSRVHLQQRCSILFFNRREAADETVVLGYGTGVLTD